MSETLPPGNPLVPDELPSRWPEEDCSHKPQPVNYRIERAQTQDEEDYQASLETILKREEAQQDINAWEGRGDPLGLDDGRPGLDSPLDLLMPGGIGSSRYRYGYGYGGPWSIVIFAISVLVMLIAKGCPGQFQALTRPGQPKAAAPASAPGQATH